MASVITSITAVFTAIMSWIVTAIESLVPLFYDATTGLTFFGTLAVVGLGIAIFTLLLNIVLNFLHLRA